ncbi:MAG: glycosyltransferase family 92 protein [Rickettsiales bacterium]|jgi:hypothetical protein|nr:glycosyltransferase family 92 protein [Rickettsiales bacterium]
MILYSLFRAARPVRWIFHCIFSGIYGLARDRDGFEKIAAAESKTNPARFLSAAAILKNEGAYIREWLDFHILQGVEYFYLYDNDSTDNVEEILAPYIEKGLAEYAKWPGRGMQKPAYLDAARRAVGKTSWLCFIDLDEFVVASKGAVADFLRTLPADAVQLSIGWANYGSNSRVEKPNGLVIENYRMRAKKTVSLKSIVRPMFIADDCGYSVHVQKVIGKTVDENGRAILPFRDYVLSIERIRVNHYSVKSKEEYKARKARGGNADDGRARWDERHFARHDTNEVYDFIMENWVPLLS